MFGVLKVGKFCFLLDRAGPAEHNRRILAESEAELLLVCGEGTPRRRSRGRRARRSRSITRRHGLFERVQR
jgi:hypothetical protein